MSDELEQMVLGPRATTVAADEVVDIVRRAFETLRLMDTDNQTIGNGIRAFNARSLRMQSPMRRPSASMPASSAA
jgi:hypothetical protein